MKPGDWQDATSLWPSVDCMIAKEMECATYRALTAIQDHGQTPLIDLKAVTYVAEQVPRDGFLG